MEMFLKQKPFQQSNSHVNSVSICSVLSITRWVVIKSRILNDVKKYGF